MANPPTDRDAILALEKRLDTLLRESAPAMPGHVRAAVGRAWMETGELLDAYRVAGEQKCTCDPHVEWCKICDPQRRGYGSQSPPVVVDEAALEQAYHAYLSADYDYDYQLGIRAAVMAYEQAKGAK